MNIQAEEQARCVILRPQGSRSDSANAASVKSVLLDRLETQQQTVILDLNEIEFMDSSGLGVIVSTLKRISGTKRLILCGLQPAVTRLFSVTRIDKVFEIATRRDEAITLAKIPQP